MLALEALNCENKLKACLPKQAFFLSFSCAFAKNRFAWAWLLVFGNGGGFFMASFVEGCGRQGCGAKLSTENFRIDSGLRSVYGRCRRFACFFSKILFLDVMGLSGWGGF